MEGKESKGREKAREKPTVMAGHVVYGSPTLYQTNKKARYGSATGYFIRAPIGQYIVLDTIPYSKIVV